MKKVFKICLFVFMLMISYNCNAADTTVKERSVDLCLGTSTLYSSTSDSNEYYTGNCMRTMKVNFTNAPKDEVVLGLGYEIGGDVIIDIKCTGEFDTKKCENDLNNLKKGSCNDNSASCMERQRQINELTEICHKHEAIGKNKITLTGYIKDKYIGDMNIPIEFYSINASSNRNEYKYTAKFRVASAYLEDVVGTAYYGSKPTNDRKYLEGGHKYYFSNVWRTGDKDGLALNNLSEKYDYSEKIDSKGRTYKNYGYSVFIKEGKDWVTNNNCSPKLYNVDRNYRIVDTADPFIQNENNVKRQISSNWRNKLFDFVNVIESNIWSKQPLYTIPLTADEIAAIKKSNNSNALAYYGLCRTGAEKDNVTKKICGIINSK